MLDVATAAPRVAKDWYARYCAVRERTLALTEPLSAEDCALQSMPDASPVKWHLAHTTWFFETFVVAPRDPRYEPFRSTFRVLFNSYYNGIGFTWEYDLHIYFKRAKALEPMYGDVDYHREQIVRYVAR